MISRYFRVSRRTALFAVILLVTVIAGCGKPTASNQPVPTHPPAKLTLYSAVNEEYMHKLAAAFEKETGIKVEALRLSAGEIVARVRAEKSAPKADVWFGGSADGFIQAKQEGLLEKYVSPQAAAIPDRLKDKDGYWTGVYIGYIGFVSNRKLLTEKGISAPTSWEDLLQPKLRGQVVAANPGTAGAAYTMLSTLVQLYGEEKAFNYMKSLHGVVKNYPRSAVAAAQMAGMGETTVGVAFLQDAVRFQEQGMKDIVITAPREGTGYEIGAVAIVKGTTQMAAAQKFIDWTLTKKAQEIGQTVGAYQYPTHPDAKSPAIAESIRNTKLIDYDFVWAGQNRKRLIEKWNELVKQ